MITIKIGGSVVDDLHPSVVADIKKVVEREGVILVHGGGKEVTKVTEQLGKETRFVISLRVNRKNIGKSQPFKYYYINYGNKKLKLHRKILPSII